MSQFERFTIQENIRLNNSKLDRLKKTKEKVESYDKELSVKNKLEAVNPCAFFIVDIKHTSQYTLKLGSNKQSSSQNPQFYVKTKTPTVLKILNERIKQCEREAEKWKKIEGEMQRKLGKKEEKKNESVDDFWRSKEAIGENQDGEQIFNIVEFSNPIDTQERKKKEFTASERIEEQQQEIIEEKSMSSEEQSEEQVFEENSNFQTNSDFPPMKIKPQKLTAKEVKEQKQTNAVNKKDKQSHAVRIQEKQEQPKKRVSKFKQERMMMKNQ